MVADADPDKPAIGSIVVGENSANVSWRPAEDEPTNPGARFYVEYVKVSDAGWRLSSLWFHEFLHENNITKTSISH